MSPSDPHPRRLKDAASQVKKLRGWAASDVSVAEPLVDALNEVTALRLLAHDHAEAAADAQDALTRANGLVALHGAVGPFTPVDDGVRFVTATTQLAAVQAGLGQPSAAGQMAAAARGWMRLLPHVDLVPYLAGRTASWLLQARARGALADGDLALANAYADAAAARAREGRADAAEDRVLVDALLLAGDARWAAGLPSDAAAFAREATQVARASLDAQVTRGRAADGQAGRFVTPLADAGRDLADRLPVAGSLPEAIAARRTLADGWAAARPALGDAALDAETHARADLARDLAGAGHLEEAVAQAGLAAEAAAALAASEARAGDRLAAQFAAVTALADALLRSDEAADARDALASLFDRYGSLRRPEGLSAWLAVATLARAEAERATGDAEASERSLRSFHELTRALRAADPRGTAVASVPDPAYALASARGAALPGPGPAPHWDDLPDDESLAASTRAHRTVADAAAPVATAPDEAAAASSPAATSPTPAAPGPGREPAAPAEPEPTPPAPAPRPFPSPVRDRRPCPRSVRRRRPHRPLPSRPRRRRPLPRLPHPARPSPSRPSPRDLSRPSPWPRSHPSQRRHFRPSLRHHARPSPRRRSRPSPQPPTARPRSPSRPTARRSGRPRWRRRARRWRRRRRPGTARRSSRRPRPSWTRCGRSPMPIPDGWPT
ncbi:hypothetical protein G7070_11400 [Propioniciclava coleopterorum]|uniref:Uncharacterized protein n=1 Tax=Propioniciclava coleopterorum TaxID=2714937 RepID=A0A6G7Y827_9ACTN|nr:hypothetical protein [Propioniciclava coleopterorum]QIK72767.1 hypothetical protein G7070_11400 [Propioniciclava coleopterorum]